MGLETRNGNKSRAAAAGPELRVLLVDDDTRHLEIQALALRRRGVGVATSTSYAGAVSVLESLPFDFVVLSQGGNCFEGRCVLESAAQGKRHTPALVYTDRVDLGAFLESMHLGAVDYLEKPLDPSALVRLIRGYLQSTRAAGDGIRNGRPHASS